MSSCLLNPQDHEPIVRCVTRRLSEGGAEVKPAEIRERSQLIQPNLVTNVFVHIFGDPSYLPVGQATTRCLDCQRTEAAVSAHELNAKEVNRLVDEEPR